MNPERKQANAVGIQFALRASIIGLIVAYLIMAMLHYTVGFGGAVLWIFNHGLAMYMVAAGVSMVVFSLIFGPWSGRQILIKKRNPALIGIFSGLMAVWGATLVGGLLAYFGGASNYAEASEAIKVYLFDPLYWVTLVGIVPILVMGYFFGKGASKRLGLE